MRRPPRLKSNFSEDQTLFLETLRGTVDILCKHLSPGDESACHPNPESLRQVERNPFNAAQRFGELQPPTKQSREAGTILLRPDRYFIDFTRLVLRLPGSPKTLEAGSVTDMHASRRKINAFEGM
jgi:hypothetical protein